jgi:hypothetical protein
MPVYISVSSLKNRLWTYFNISGFNVAHRRRKTGMVGFQHRLTKEDAMKWFQQKVCVTSVIVLCNRELAYLGGSGPLGGVGASLHRWLLALWRTISPSIFKASRSILHGLLDLELKGNVFLWSGMNHLVTDIVSYPRRPEASITPLKASNPVWHM